MKVEKIKAISKIILFCIFIILSILISFKLFVFYVPFLIGFVIAEILEPIIISIKNKSNLTRKASSILVLVIFFAICISLILLGSIFLISEVTDALSGMNGYIEIVMDKVQAINIDDWNINSNIKSIIENATVSFINEAGNIIKNYLSNFIKLIGRIPNFFVYLVITILSTYFISSDKFYILDRMEYHFPKKWIGKVREKTRNIKESLGGYLKAEIIMIFISFIIVLVGLSIFNLIGLPLEYPLLMALIIGFVDALPILRKWYSTNTMGSNFFYKFRYITRISTFRIIYFYTTCKTIYRTKNCE